MGIFFTWHSSEHGCHLDVKWKPQDESRGAGNTAERSSGGLLEGVEGMRQVERCDPGALEASTRHQKPGFTGYPVVIRPGDENWFYRRVGVAIEGHRGPC